MDLAIPGKTFLAGEYSVLLGGSALGLATKPCFEVRAVSHNAFVFHPQSPAGRYLKINSLPAPAVQISDPYSQGGFGKSTAEFFAVVFLKLRKNNFTEIRKNYIDLYAPEKVKPSGADLAFQYFGHVCEANLRENKFESFRWPFAELDFLIVATGLKIATHDHLAALDLDCIKHLPEISDQVIQAFKKESVLEFLAAMKIWTEALESAGLTHENSLKIKNLLKDNKDILLVKPCGALGADVLLVFCKSSHSDRVAEFVKHKNLKVVATGRDLCEGIVSYVG
ncbi:MAG: hypothetical protein H7328_01870 [Bdellovibrio sp.]|nr:hypothetical protein [Bdellovibrio sp.]